MWLLRGVVTAGTVLVGACGGAPAGDSSPAGGEPPAESATAAGTDHDSKPSEAAPPEGSSERNEGQAPSKPAEATGAMRGPDSTGRAGSDAGSAEPPGRSSGEAGRLDAFDQRAGLPEGAVRVASGRNAVAEYRLYVWRKDGRTCLHFASQSSTSGSATGSCHQELPLDRSTATSEHGRFAFGLVTAKAARVRFDHSGGTSETFDVVASSGFGERFYMGEIAPTPLERTAALDADGKVVAERTDTNTLNAKE